MPRRARHYIAHQPYYIVQRGNKREPCFIEIENYQFYLELRQELSKKYGVAVHAYCLMTNHIHFLVTPSTEDAISVVMKQIGSRYAQYINKNSKRTGTLWRVGINPV
ncbi:MAG: transposase [Cellvibrio sp.]|nr:transposase [Cellvibrio sp.]